MTYNVYDFDKCIFHGDASTSFYFFCLLKHPSILKYIFRQMKGFILYLFGKIDKTRWKEYNFSFLNGIKDIDLCIQLFWEKKGNHIKPWYLLQKKNTDLIITASPEFLITPMAQSLHVHLLGSIVDKKTGRFLEENCYGEEKKRRFLKVFPKDRIQSFYSDSMSDAPLACLAKEAFIVQGNKRIPWNSYQVSFLRKLLHLFFDRSFFLFLFVGVINTLNGVLFSYLFSLFFNDNLAFVVGYLTSLTVSYFLNSFISFKATLSFSKYIKFCISYLPNFIIQNLCVILFMNILTWPKLFAYTLAAILGLPITYLCLRLFTFRTEKKKAISIFR